MTTILSPATTLSDHFSPSLNVGCFYEQIKAYLSQLGDPNFMEWLTDAVEKEKMKQQHLQGIIDHLESEVSTLSRESVNSMKQSMLKVQCIQLLLWPSLYLICLCPSSLC